MANERELTSETPVSCFPQPSAARLVTLVWDRIFRYFVSWKLLKSSSNFSSGCSFMCIIKGPYSNFIFHVEECYAQPENKLFSKTPYGGGRVGGMAWDAVKRRHQGILFFLHTSVCLFGNVEVVLKPGDTCSGSSLNRNSSESIMSFGATDTLQFGGYTGDSEISPRSFMLSTAAAGQLVAPDPHLSSFIFQVPFCSNGNVRGTLQIPCLPSLSFSIRLALIL